MNAWSLARICLLCCAIAVRAGAAPGAASGALPGTNPPPAQLAVSGLGFLGNRKAKRTLQNLLVEKRGVKFFDATFVEDAALIILSELNREGFLHPALATEIRLDDGRRVSYLWDKPGEAPLPANLRARKVRFVIREGLRYHYRQLEFVGLQRLKEKQARAFFIETAALLPLNRYRIYTPERLKRGLRNITETLNRQGFNDAEASVEKLVEDDRKGEVRVTIRVKDGPRYFVQSVRDEIFYDTNSMAAETRTMPLHTPFSHIWSQDYAQMLRTNFYKRGFPDVKVAVTPTRFQTNDGTVYVDANAEVHAGPRVRVGGLEFKGNKRTRESILRRRVPLDPGDWLDRADAEKGRLRLSRLGVFESVDLNYTPIDDNTRQLTYSLREGKRIDFNLLAGYGSYELVRGGFELEQFNVFGRAHHARLRVVQSFKSSSGIYTYTMPELLGEEWDIFFRGFGLRREEVSFTRIEYGAGAGVQRALRSIDSTVALRYDYQILNATEADIDVPTQGVENPRVGALTLDFRHDRRNNPLYPQRGYKIFSTLEVASDFLAGNVDYQRFELATAYHWPIDRSRRVNLGLSHGFIASAGTPQEDLPFTRRFFPGGENSIRGYQEGEASPRNTDGKIVGGETYFLGTVEFEQAITPRWSLVVFSDSLGVARRLRDYPGSEFLFSVGGGIRWRTIIGPVRLEYGHNLNPREDDPAGTVHFSLGFPF